MKRTLTLAVMGAVVAACGGGGGSGGGGGGGSSTQIGFVIPPTDCTSESIAGVVVLVATNRSIDNACTQASNACVEYKNLDSLALIVANYDVGGTATAVGPGTYPLTAPAIATSGTLAIAGVGQTDANCNDVGPSGSATGSITITSVTASAVSGSYDVTVGSDHLTGSIDATICTTAFAGDVCSGSVGGTCTGTTQCI